MKKYKGLVVGAMLTLGLWVGAGDAHATEAMTISISSGTLALNLAPNSLEGTFGKGNLNIDISLAVRGGYNLTITGSDNVGNLVGTNDSSHIISSISGTVTEENFSASANTQYNNKWGYKVEKNSVANNTFKSAPTTTADTIDTVSNFTGTNNYVMSLGARANTATPIDSYKADFVIAVVSTITCNSSATTIGEAICMQDMNDSVISSMVEGTQYRLMDNRDNKLYYIAKMKDGRVWMTQNLDLDLETTPNKVAALTSDNTNLTTAYATDGTTLLPGYSINGSTITFTPSVATTTDPSDWKTTTSGDANYNTLPQSLDYGDYYRYTDTNGTTTTFSGDNARASCESAHPDGTCDHFHSGNYYDWTAAVAMNNTNNTSNGGADNNYYSTSYFTAANSICPKGWRLPQGRTSTVTNSTGYYTEFNYTWFAEGMMTDYIAISGGGVYAPNGYNKASNSPLYLARVGYKGSVNGLTNVNNAYYWASTVNQNSSSWASRIDSSKPYPFDTYTRRYGQAVRCIATPSTNTGSTIVTFNKNANDATGSMNTQTINANSFSSLTSNSFTRAGYAFNSWNTSADGSGTSYADAGTFYAKMGNDTTNVTLYAIWDKVWTVTFNTGSNVTNIIFDGNTYTNGQSVVVIDSKSYMVGGNFPAKSGFNSWTTTANGTLENSNAPATNYTVTGDATLTLTGKETTTNMKTLTNPGSGSVSSTCKNDPVTPELVYDERDNEAYWVAVLCDGNYWMLDNLRLDLTNSTVINNLSSTNTNATDAQLNYLKNGGGTDQYPATGLPGSEWTSSGSSYIAPRVSARFKDNIAPVVDGLGSGKIGVYYNYCATSAGTYCYASNAGVDKDNTYRDIEGDICPAGWRLPSGSSTRITDYGTLDAAYNGATGGQALALRNRLSTPISGIYSGNSQTNLGTYGYFWSSTWFSTSNMYTLNSYSTGASLNNNYNRNSGLSIRCVLGSS